MAHWLAYWKTFDRYGLLGAKAHVCSIGYGSARSWSVSDEDTVWVVGRYADDEWRLLQRLFAARVEKLTPPEQTRVLADPERSAFFEPDGQLDLAHVLKHLQFESGKRIAETGRKIGRFIQSVRRLSGADAELLVSYATFNLGDEYYVDGVGPEMDPEGPRRRQLQVNQIIRNPKLARRLKDLYRNQCQMRGTAIKLSDGRMYSEVHHIKPLGEKDPGPDDHGNMLCVCPNCHVRLDYRAVRLNRTSLTIAPEHQILDRYIAYHNAKV